MLIINVRNIEMGTWVLISVFPTKGGQNRAEKLRWSCMPLSLQAFHFSYAKTSNGIRG